MTPPLALLNLINDDRSGRFAKSMARAQFASLLSEIEFFIDQVKSRIKNSSRTNRGRGTPATSAGFRHLRDSLIEFHQFGFDFFNYVYNNNVGNLTDQTTVLRKIQTEILALRPLVEQRHSGELFGFLTKADALAIDFLKKCDLLERASFANQVSDAGEQKTLARFLVFFEESPWIKQGRIAYKRVPSISLPLSTWRSPWLWQGLAHEVGHYVFQNIESLDGQEIDLKMILVKGLEESLGDEKAAKMWSEWIEEAFSDIYSVQILGPSYTDSLICQVILPNLMDGSSLLRNDHDHPIALLRPFFHFELLRQLMTNHNEIANTKLAEELQRLEKFWKDICNALIPPDKLANVADDPFRFWEKKQIQGFRISVGTCINKHIPQIVDLLLRFLKEHKRIPNFYHPNLHDAVINVANQFIQMATTDHAQSIVIPDSLQERFPILFLSVSWYAWKKAYSEPGMTSTERLKVVEAINALITQLTQEQDNLNDDTNDDANVKTPNVVQLIKDSVNEPKSKYFIALLEKKKSEVEKLEIEEASKERKLIDLLLIENFAIRNRQEIEINCPAGQIPACYCSEPLQF